MLGLRRGTVNLVDHDGLWAKQAAEAIASLISIIGENAVSAEHVGSTAVAGIKAKPIIDIAVGVKDLRAVYDKVEALKVSGFLHRPDNDDEWQVFFCCMSEDDIVTHHIHVVRFKDSDWNGYITFRDRLRENKDEAMAYERLKLELMERYQEDRNGYTEAKAEFILSVMEKGSK